MVELLVPEGQEGVALSYNVTDQFGVVETVQPGLPAGGVHVGVGSKERHERTSLVPTHQQLRAWSVEEAADISCKREGSHEQFSSSTVKESGLQLSGKDQHFI